VLDIGKHHTLIIDRDTEVGLFLVEKDSGEEVLLPNKYVPESFKIGGEIEVFVYLDFAERKIATTLQPKILLDDFAYLEVADVTRVGAFLDWGLEKQLFVPFKEQRHRMEIGASYVVLMRLDRKTNRLFATNKFEKFLQNHTLTVKEGDEVDLLIYRETDLGFLAIINQQHLGLIYDNEYFNEIDPGDEMKGYIKKIRSDDKIDLSLQPIGYENFIDENTTYIYNTLMHNNGFIPFNDKSSPESIYEQFQMSKKAFKKSIGALYKDRKIVIKPEGIELVK